MPILQGSTEPAAFTSPGGGGRAGLGTPDAAVAGEGGGVDASGAGGDGGDAGSAGEPGAAGLGGGGAAGLGGGGAAGLGGSAGEPGAAGTGGGGVAGSGGAGTAGGAAAAGGELVWAKRAGGSAEDFALSVSVVPDGSSLLAGYFRDTATFGPGEPMETALISTGEFDLFVARYEADGSLAWAKRAGVEEYDSGLSISALGDGSALIAGSFLGTATFGPGESGQTVLSAAGQRDVFEFLLGTQSFDSFVQDEDSTVGWQQARKWGRLPLFEQQRGRRVASRGTAHQPVGEPAAPWTRSRPCWQREDIACV
ncbi:MAG: hypothetical protein MJD61_02655 [Proteobacteria bacterium]|nr:hypothetical protein [Pseudomonadota bacterium]